MVDLSTRRPGAPLLATLALLLALAAALVPGPAAAQRPPFGTGSGDEPAPAAEETADAAEDEAAPTREEVEVRREELAGIVAELQGRLAEAPEETAAELRERIERLESLRRTLKNQIEELRRRAELEAEGQRIEEAQRQGVEVYFDHPPPYTVAELDGVLDELRAARAGRELLGDAIEAAERTVEDAEKELAEAERQRRLAQEALDQNQDPAAASGLRQRLEERRREAEQAAAQLRLRRLQLENLRQDRANRERREARLTEVAAWARSHLAASPEEEEEVLDELEERRQELAQELDAAERRSRSAAVGLSGVQERLAAEPDPGPALVAMERARRLESEAADRQARFAGRQIERLEEREELWTLRFRLLRGQLSAAELAAAESRFEDELADLRRARSLEETRLEELEKELRGLRDRLENTGEGATAGRWLRQQRERTEELIALQETELERLDEQSELVGRILGEVRERRGRVSFGERVSGVYQGLLEVWNYELIAVEDRPITVGKVAVALLLIVLGYLLSKWATGRLGRMIFPRLGLDSGVAAAYQTLIFYTLMVGFFVYALHLVSIPLTIFTVLGGVVAIGVGFGSQNIVNNFISGLILLAERPIKVGDLIDVGGTYGLVERIGLRSAWIRSGDNTHIIVPNSSFLENNVLNWTMSDDRIRTFVDVGVAYGSPAEEVTRLLEQAMSESSRILETPPPEVLFLDFGDNALVFRAYFWVRVRRPLDLRRAQSELRYLVDRDFQQASITIAFPQRDVHLDSLSPVSVRLVREGEAE